MNKKYILGIFLVAITVGFLVWLSGAFATPVSVKDKNCSRTIGQEGFTGQESIGGGEPYGCDITLENPSSEDEYVRVNVKMLDSSGDVVGEVIYGARVPAEGTSSSTVIDEVNGNVSSVSVRLQSTSQDEFTSGTVSSYD